MLSFTHIIGFIIFFTFVTATSHSKKDSKACALQLEKIIASPLEQDGGHAGEAFLRWADEVRIAGPLLFTPNNASIYWSLEKKYGMTVIVFDGFNKGWIYGIEPTPTVSYVPFIAVSANFYRSLINYPGFTYRQEVDKYYFTFLVWNTDGRFIFVTFIINRDQLNNVQIC